MTEAEKADCLLRARQGFDQGAQLLCWGDRAPRTAFCCGYWEQSEPEAEVHGSWAAGGFGPARRDKKRREFLSVF